MGRSRYKIYQNNAPHFLTSTIINWIPLFTRPATTQIILDALVWRQQNRYFKLYGYVILENHCHFIIQSPYLKQQIHDFKAYTATQLIQYLELNKVEKILKQLKFFKKAHKIDSNYQVWEEGSHPQLLQNEEMLLQKLAYIHENPVKRGYVDQAVHWRYSSARNYMGSDALIPVYTQWWTKN